MKSENKKINNNTKEKLPFSSSRYNKNNFEEFCKLEINRNIKSISRNDLPDELSEETCEFIDLFRRMTVDEETEWNFYIDYENNEIIHCLHGQATEVKDNIHEALMKDRKIVTIHNHPKGTFSAPSSDNFEILEHEFENYEIICAENEYWILESRSKYSKKYVEKFKTKIETIFQDIKQKSKNPNNEYSNELSEYINSSKDNIKLTNKEYR